MKHVSIRKIRFVVRRYREGETSNRLIWKTEKISKSSFYRIIGKYKDLWPEYKLKYIHKSYRRPGKAPIPVSKEAITEVIAARLLYKSGALRLEQLLKAKGISLPHNTINSILMNAGMTKVTKKRSKQKKYVRWERRHSLSLWQTDWSVLGDKWLIVFLDDASRFVVGWGLFDHATSENSVKVLKEAMEKYGKPRNMLTGRDTQFYASSKEGKEQGETYFQQFLKANKINHILARVNHPQTCGKIERFFGEVKNRIRWKDFDNVGDIVIWHNEVKPHESLDLDTLETPIRAFQRKMHPKEKAIKLVVEV
jgi:putative transposase